MVLECDFLFRLGKNLEPMSLERIRIEDTLLTLLPSLQENAAAWQVALNVFWEVQPEIAGTASTHCFDSLNRVFVKAEKWQTSLQATGWLFQTLFPTFSYI